MNSAAMQTAIFTALNVPALTDLLTASYMFGPIAHEQMQQVADSGEGAFFPYVTFSIPADPGFNDKDTSGNDARVQVDAWSRTNDTAVKVIADMIFSLLHRQPLSIAGHITTENEGVDFSRDPDGITRRAMLTFRVLALE
jgi:hypothetical protein